MRNHWQIFGSKVPAQCVGLALCALMAVGCGTTGSTTDEDAVVDLDGVNGSDVDLNGLDVDVSKSDVKTDTAGTDTDARDTQGTDAVGTDATPGTDTISVDADATVGSDVESADTDATVGTDAAAGTDAVSGDAVDAVDVAAGCTSDDACADSNPCTTNKCHLDDGLCYVDFNKNACDDGNPCTSGEACDFGGCSGGTAKVCNDDNPCTDDSCDSSGNCVNMANAVTCDDGIACTLADTCTASACVGVPDNATCSDGNVCTTDSCDVGQKKCVHLSNDVTCTDGNVCTKDDACTDGVCAGIVKKCNDNEACTSDSCDSDTGNCINAPVAPVPCNDGNPCTTGEMCGTGEGAGLCVGVTATNCDDANSCTADSCDPTTLVGCKHDSSIAIACSDSNVCTVGDLCGGGICIPGTATVCNDDNVCTDDSCDATNGCVFLANAVTCDDGDLCTLASSCTETICLGTPITCTDDNPTDCQFFACDPATGSCHNWYSDVWDSQLDNSSGWTTQGEWQFGLPVASTDQTFGNADPDYGDNQNNVFGTVIGGTISNTPHDYYYLTSPVINLSAFSALDGLTYDTSIIFEFSNWLNFKTTAGQLFRVEFSSDGGRHWDVAVDAGNTDLTGNGWNYGGNFVKDQDAQIPAKYMVSQFRIRFGYKIEKSLIEAPIVSGASINGIYLGNGNCWD